VVCSVPAGWSPQSTARWVRTQSPVTAAQKRPGPVPDRILVARLTGEPRWHARWRPLTESETAEAIAELQEIAGDRADLLGEVCGTSLGFSEGTLDEPRARFAAWLCRLAGADEALIPQWIAEGKRRAANARMRPQAADTCNSLVTCWPGLRLPGPPPVHRASVRGITPASDHHPTGEAMDGAAHYAKAEELGTLSELQSFRSCARVCRSGRGGSIRLAGNPRCR
jgi:hypothetical protein